METGGENTLRTVEIAQIQQDQEPKTEEINLQGFRRSNKTIGE